MSENILYANFRVRSLVPKALVNALKLDVQIVDPRTVEKQFAEQFPLKKVPALLGPHGFKLTEQLAINYYLMNLSTDEKLKAQLLGSPDDLQTQSQILKWESFANSDLIINEVLIFRPLTGEAPYVKKNVDAAKEYLDVIAGVYETRLKDYTYLVGENITLADLVSVAAFSRGFSKAVFGSEWRKQHPAIVRWFNTVTASSFFKDEFKDFKFIDKALEPPQPASKKKEKKPAATPAAAAAPKKKEVRGEEEEQAPQEKKPKHPLELLGKSTFVLDEWKRKYSNEDTRPVALPWFWANYNPEEYSIWRVDYKYNDELTLTFMSNNLIGGFFSRLTASTKFVFGSLVVYGENNNNGIIGAILVRGQDYVPAFDVAPDWESYEYTKLDPTKEEDKEFVNDMWAWDRPVIVSGEPRDIADGKVLK